MSSTNLGSYKLGVFQQMTTGPAQDSTVADDVATPNKQQFYRSELDLLRFFAFIMVFVAHTVNLRHFNWVFEAGGNGVCLFFLLSAYLIAELLMRERDSTQSVHVGAFFARRILRIWPVYFLVIGLGVVFGKLVPIFHVPAQSIPWLLLMAGNFYVMHHGWTLNALGPLWSLSIEEQFYFAVPAITKIGGRRALWFTTFLCFPLAYSTLLWMGHTHASPSSQVWVNSLVQFQFFAVGTLLALYFHERDWKPAGWKRIGLVAAGGAGLAAGQKAIHLHQTAPLQTWSLCLGYFVVLLCCTLLFLGFFRAQFRRPKALMYLGRISYGLYVYQTFFLLIFLYGRHHTSGWKIFPFALLILILTIFIASLSYYFVERPFLRLKQRFTFINSTKIS
jgi:peptidoglycan/LPS O-acetylase OafA/YrhL